MGLIERIKNIFKYQAPTAPRGSERVPFVQLLGYEKTYGKPQPEDFAGHIAAYKSWAYACAWKNATSVAKCDLCLYKMSYDNKKEKKQKIEVEEHPFIDLMRNVNSFSNRFELLTITQLFLELTGNAYWWIPRSNLRIPYMIWNIPSHWVKIVPSQQNFIDGYVVQVPGSGKLLPFDEEEIIHFKFPSPFDIYYGTGPLWAARFGIDLNEQIKTWGINFFLNDARPGGILTTEQAISPDSYKRLKDQWNLKHRGSANAGKIAILGGGLKYEQTGSNIRDARFDDISREIRDEILAMFGVPASKLGLVEDVNRANADANDYTYQKETIVPRLTIVEEKLNEKLIPIYDPKLKCQFKSPVPEDFQAKLQERRENIASGFSTIDEEREKEGLDPFNLPETSKPLIPFSLVPAGTPKEDPTTLQEEPQNDSQKSFIQKSKDKKWEIFLNATAPQEKLLAGVMSRFFESQHRDVSQKLAARKGVINKDIYSSIAFNLEEQNTKLKNSTRINVKTAYMTGLEMAMKEVGYKIDFNLFEPNVLRAVEQRIGFFADKVNRSTLDLLREAIEEGFTSGESIDKIVERVDNVFKFSEDFRAKRIAQTEVIGATNSGQLRAYDEAGVQQKEWLTARDEKVRDSHQIDGQVVELHQSFTTGLGTKLLYPGDRSSGAPAGEVINCRCTVVPVIKPKTEI